MIKIDKDIPPPMTKLIGATLNKLAVGESFRVEGTLHQRNTLYRKTRELAAEGKTFTSMMEDSGIRTWRLE
jgi:hypothetical protein